MDLYGKNQHALREMLQRLLMLRSCEDAWNFLLDDNPLDNARRIFCATQFHITGHCSSKWQLLSSSSEDPFAAKAALQALESPTARTLDTAWYYVPYRNFDAVSVGAVISENDAGRSSMFTQSVERRHTRYARNDRTGDFLTLHVCPEANLVEIFFINPKSTTERRRALIRFDYDGFTAATATVTSAALERLLRSVNMSHIVTESRFCPTCRMPPSVNCGCPIRFQPASDAYDLEHNARNMLEIVGSFAGFSYHFERDRSVLDEYFEMCNLVGGIGASALDKSDNLVKWGVQHCLNGLPMSIVNVLRQPVLHLEAATPPDVSANSIDLPDDMCLPASISNEIAFENSELSELSSGPVFDWTQQQSSAVSLPVAVQRINAAQPPAVIKSPTTISPTPIMSAGISKPAHVPKRRGRRPRQKPVKPAQPVRIAPAAGLVSAGPMEFQSEEERKAHRKVLRSRESAAKSNQKRKEKRLLQKKLQEEQERRQAQQT